MKLLKLYTVLLILAGFFSCEDFIYKEQPLVVESENSYKDWIDYRSSVLGLYALQQDLVEQMIILGELRGDLLKVTPNAEPDLLEIQNFDVKQGNKYVSATNFYRLISACNNLIRTLERNHPEVLEDNPIANDYHRIYGEALCMRGWTYFNAARIYGKIPYIPDELTKYEAIIDYISNPGSTFYVDTGRYVYDYNGVDKIDVSDTVYYPVDTVFLDTVQFETYPKRFVDIQTVVDKVNDDLTKRLKYVGVKHGEKLSENLEYWEAIIWTDYSKNYLLGQMALTIGDINTAIDYFYPLLFNYENFETGSNNIRFGLDNRFANNKWADIFTGIDINEHIYTLWFQKENQQTHNLQRMFDNTASSLYYMQPTSKAIDLWETEWKEQNPEPQDLWDGNKFKELREVGIPGDNYRGYEKSYVYKKDGEFMTLADVNKMLDLRMNGQEIDVLRMMDGVDTLVYKYSIGQEEYDNDAFVCLYRAASVHLYAAEIAINSPYRQPNGTNTAPGYLNGDYNDVVAQLGTRGRVGLYTYSPGDGYAVVQDPYTNQPIKIIDFSVNGVTNQELERKYFEEQVLLERAKELAFEGDRFYDIMRVAKRRNEPSFLADMIADAKGKYDSNKREEIRAKLMNEENWYLPFFLTDSE